MDPLYGGGGKDREEILKCLEQAPPQVVVITHHDPLHRFGTMTSDRQVRDFTPLAGFLKSNYRQAGMIGDYEILEHTRGAATSTEQPRAEASMPTSPSTPAPASR